MPIIMLKYESFLLVPFFFKVTRPVDTYNGAQRAESVKEIKKKNRAMGANYLRSYLAQQHTSVIQLE